MIKQELASILAPLFQRGACNFPFLAPMLQDNSSLQAQFRRVGYFQLPYLIVSTLSLTPLPLAVGFFPPI